MRKGGGGDRCQRNISGDQKASPPHGPRGDDGDPSKGLGGEVRDELSDRLLALIQAKHVDGPGGPHGPAW